ncbi:hypothetical protein L6R52_36270 [Myxococcota bacterium]|nr:hypothetical protein [Myxococcota bacterium]
MTRRNTSTSRRILRSAAGLAGPGRALRTLGLAVAVGIAGAGCSSKKADPAETKLWGRDLRSEETAARAKEPLDPQLLDVDDKIRARVLAMDFEEVVARAGFVEHKGVGKFELTTAGRTLAVVEDTTITHGLHGSFRVLQKDGDGEITRETVYNNGIFYARNGAGEMRVQGILKDQHLVVRDEAWQPLRVYTSYFGPRLGLVKVGASSVDGRSAAQYRFTLVPGPDLVTVAGIEGAKKPLSLKGDLWVDESTSVPIRAKLEGVLEIPSAKADGPSGKLELALDFTLKSVEGVEIKPESFVPTIKHHPADLDPLGFLDGGTRTSTVIGGKRPKTTKPPESLEASPTSLVPTATKAEDAPSTEKKKKTR